MTLMDTTRTRALPPRTPYARERARGTRAVGVHGDGIGGRIDIGDNRRDGTAGEGTQNSIPDSLGANPRNSQSSRIVSVDNENTPAVEPCGRRGVVDDAGDWHLSFRAEGPGPEMHIRVRRLLKTALRSFGLRCTDYSVGGSKRTSKSTNGSGASADATSDCAASAMSSASIAPTSTRYSPKVKSVMTEITSTRADRQKKRKLKFPPKGSATPSPIFYPKMESGFTDREAW